MHTHLNDYETGKTNSEGDPKINQPIRMFSPADVNTLMSLAQTRTTGDYGNLYGMMVSSYGNYTIKFTGTSSDIKTGFDTPQWRNSYLAFMKNEKGTLEAKFLRFMKEKMNINGVELYKVKNDGKIQKKALNSNNKVTSTDCP